MLIENSKKFGVFVDNQLIHLGNSSTEGLSGKLFDLNVKKFTEVAEPFNELRCGGPRKLENHSVFKTLLKFFAGLYFYYKM